MDFHIPALKGKLMKLKSSDVSSLNKKHPSDPGASGFLKNYRQPETK
jgi:hypothetical protein